MYSLCLGPVLTGLTALAWIPVCITLIQVGHQSNTFGYLSHSEPVIWEVSLENANVWVKNGKEVVRNGRLYDVTALDTFGTIIRISLIEDEEENFLLRILENQIAGADIPLGKKQENRFPDLHQWDLHELVQIRAHFLYTYKQMPTSALIQKPDFLEDPPPEHAHFLHAYEKA